MTGVTQAIADKKRTSASWLAFKGRPVRQSNYGRYKTLVSRGEGRTLETVGITADTADLASEVAKLVEIGSELLEALRLEDLAHDGGVSDAQRFVIFKDHGWDETVETWEVWLRRKRRAALAKGEA